LKIGSSRFGGKDFETSENDHPAAESQIAEERSPQPHRCESLQTLNFKFSFKNTGRVNNLFHPAVTWVIIIIIILIINADSVNNLMDSVANHIIMPNTAQKNST
jgi:hypothetical protein